MKSSTPVTVTVWATFQLAAVNVRLEVETVPSAGLDEERPMVTLAEGALLRATLNVAVPPASVVGPLMALTLMPAMGLTVMLAVSVAVLKAVAPPVVVVLNEMPTLSKYRWFLVLLPATKNRT